MTYLRAYTVLNFGDDLLIKLLCDNNKNEHFCIISDSRYKTVFKDVENLEVLSDEFSYLTQFKQDKKKYFEEHEKILKNISKKCDTFIYIGGSIFMEFGSSSIDMLKQLKTEISLFKESYIIGANFGPYITQEYFNFVHDEIIPMLAKISFRDKYSYNLFKDLDNVTYAPDVVFSLPTNKSIKNKELGISLVTKSKIEERYQDNYDEYLDKIVLLAEEYIKHGYIIKLLSFCSHEKDDLAIDNFLNRVPYNNRQYFSAIYYNGDIKFFLNQISFLDTIIATRFHAKVLALKYSCNLIPVCYGVKSNHLLDDLGIDKYVDFSNIHCLSNDIVTIDNERIKQLETEAKNHFNYKLFHKLK